MSLKIFKGDKKVEMNVNKRVRLIVSLLITGVLLSGCFPGITHVTGVEIVGGDKFVELGKSLQLSAKIEPIDATNTTVLWESSNINYVTVDENGLIEAIQKGSAEVTVITEDGGFEDTIVVYVVDVVPETNDPANSSTCDPCNTCDPCDPCGGCYDLCECETDTCDTCNTCSTCDPCTTCEPDTCDPCDPCGGCYDLIECETDTCNICEPECDPCNPDSDCYNACECQDDPCNTCVPECDPCDPNGDCYNPCDESCNTCDPCDPCNTCN